MPDNVSFRLVKDKDGAISKWYPFWVGTIAGFVFVFIGFAVAVVDITRANRLHTFLLELSDETAASTQARRVVRGTVKPPTITFASPMAGEMLNGRVLINASAIKGQNAVAMGKIFIDGRDVAVFTDGPLAYTWDTTVAANGEHVIGVLAVDAMGYMSVAHRKVMVGN